MAHRRFSPGRLAGQGAEFTWWLLAGSLAFWVATATALADDDSPISFDPKTLIDSQIDLTLSTGETIADIKVLKVAEGRTEGTVASVTVADKASGKPKLLGAVRIREIAPPGGRPVLVYDPARRALVPPDASKAASKDKGNDNDPPEAPSDPVDRQWPELTDEQQQAAVKNQKAFLEQAREKMGNGALQLYETKRFLFYSDIPAQAISTMYVPYLDQMYEKLCAAFGLDPQKNLWRGKATIIAFANKMSFVQFETMCFSPPESDAMGLAHCRSDGEVLISCYAGNDPKYFAMVLVHETAHGFTFRYKSAHHPPSWLNEGVSEWIANEVVSGPGWVPRKVQRVLQHIQTTRSLGGDYFTAEHIDAWQYPVAATMMELLLKYNAQPQSRTRSGSKSRRTSKAETSRFLKLFEGVKQGTSWEDALQEAYGWTPADLAQRYGQAIGVAELQP